MTRKLKRTDNYELTLEIKREKFIRPPRDHQRNWLLNRLLKECGDDLAALDQTCASFVPAGTPADLGERTNTTLGDDEIMENTCNPQQRNLTAILSAEK